MIDPFMKWSKRLSGLCSLYEGRAQVQAERAANAYNMSLAIDPKYSQAMNNMMHVLLALKKYEEATKIFLKI